MLWAAVIRERPALMAAMCLWGGMLERLFRTPAREDRAS